MDVGRTLRVPLALCGPGFDNGGRVSDPVSTMDLPPTLLDAAGLPVPPSTRGPDRPHINADTVQIMWYLNQILRARDKKPWPTSKDTKDHASVLA